MPRITRRLCLFVELCVGAIVATMVVTFVILEPKVALVVVMAVALLFGRHAPWNYTCAEVERYHNDVAEDAVGFWLPLAMLGTAIWAVVDGWHTLGADAIPVTFWIIYVVDRVAAWSIRETVAYRRRTGIRETVAYRRRARQSRPPSPVAVTFVEEPVDAEVLP
jgi:hypothetical protein